MLKKILLTIVLFTTSFILNAKVFYGFDVGSQNKEAVKQSLDSEKATYANLSYKGEGSLPVIIIKRSPNLEKEGALNQAVLMFTQNNILFGLNVKYIDDGKMFETIKKDLDNKYGAPKQAVEGEGQYYYYIDKADPDFGVQLSHVKSSNAKDNMTSIMFFNKTLFREAEQQQKAVDAKITKKTN